MLFSDVPSQTTVLMHEKDVGDTLPLKQRPYRVCSDKRCRLKLQVEYMLAHGIDEPCISARSSPCLLTVKSNGEDRFCTDYITFCNIL